MRQCENCFEYYDEFTEHSCPYCGFLEGREERPGHLKVGSRLQLGRYRIGKCLGQGSFGITYLAWDENQGIKTAIKEFYPSQRVTRGSGSQVIMVNASDTERFTQGKKQFQEEANKLARFHDIPEVVPVTECFEENATVYIVMKYIEGENLEQYLQNYEQENGKGTFPAERAVEMLLPVMRAMKVVNDNQTYHLDIAPDNIMITGEEKAVLIDFGIAKNLFGESEDDFAYKQGYSPVEQYRRAEPNASTDVYAMAATLYRMLTGNAPADSRLRLQSCRHKKKDCLEPLGKLRPDVGENIRTAVHNALNLLPVNRTADMQELIWELTAPVPVELKKEKWKRVDLSDWPWWGKVLIGVGAAGVLTFAVLFGTGVIGFQSGLESKIVLEEGKTRVPLLINRTSGIAGQSAAAAELNCVITGKEYSYAVPKNYVMSQSIHAGTVVDTGTKVELVISAGGELVQLPSLEGTKEEDAVRRLKTLGVSPIVVRVETDVMEPGIVLGFSGLQYENYAEKGSEVTLCVAAEPVPEPVSEELSAAEGEQPGTDKTVVSGTQPSVFASSAAAVPTVSPVKPSESEAVKPSASPEETQDDTNSDIEIPNLIGKQFIDAIGILKGKKDLKLQVDQKMYSEKAAGTIIGQRTETDNQKTIIYVTLSLGPEQIWVPDVTLLSEAEAKAKLEGLGFTAEVTDREYDEELAEGLVIEQSPKSNTYGKAGDQINLIISLGKGPKETAPNLTEQEESTSESRNQESDAELWSSETAAEVWASETVGENQPLEKFPELTEETSDVPDWLKETEATVQEIFPVEMQTERQEPDTEIPDWLREPETTAAQAEETAFNDGDAEVLEIEKDGTVWQYEIVSGEYAVLTGCSTQTEEILVESFAGEYPVTKLADGAFEGCQSVKSLVLSENIAKLGSSLFGDRQEPVQVTCLGPISELGSMPFPAGSQITVADEESQLWFSFYYDNVYLENGDRETELQETAATSLEVSTDTVFEAVIGKSTFTYTVQANGNAVLTKCISSEEKETADAYIQGYLISGIADAAFAECWNMKRLQISEGIISIGSNLFASEYRDEGLQVIVPASVRTIGWMPFPQNTVVIAPEGSYAFTELSLQGYDVRAGSTFVEDIAASQEPVPQGSSQQWNEDMPETTTEPEIWAAAEDINIYDPLAASGIEDVSGKVSQQYVSANQIQAAWLVPVEDGKQWSIYIAQQTDIGQKMYLADCTERSIGFTDQEIFYIYDKALMRKTLSEEQTEENLLEMYDLSCIDFCLEDESVVFIGCSAANEIGLYQYTEETGEAVVNLLWTFAGTDVPEIDFVTENYLYFRYQGYYWYFDRTMGNADILSDRQLYARDGYFFFLENGMLWRVNADGSGRIFVLYAQSIEKISFDGGRIYYLSDEQEGQSVILYDIEGNWLYQWELDDTLQACNVMEGWLYGPKDGTMTLLTQEY